MIILLTCFHTCNNKQVPRAYVAIAKHNIEDNISPKGFCMHCKSSKKYVIELIRSV